MTALSPVRDQAVQVSVTLASAIEAAEVPVTILGQNLEVHTRSVAALLSERLENPKFAGPPDAGGLAPPWRPRNLTPQMNHLEWIPGIGRSGDGVHWLANHHPGGRFGATMVQTHRRVRAGEHLMAELWAHTRHQPTTIAIGLYPQERIAKPYVTKRVEVDTTYWRRYEVELIVPADDDDAVFDVRVEGLGQVWIDQIHLREAGEAIVASAAVDAVKRLGVGSLRYPGGTRAATYRWREGIGPVERRPDSFDRPHRYLRLNDFGTDEYLELCHEAGIVPHMTVSTGDATPEEAGEWAAYVHDWFAARSLDPGTPYFQIGNEDYGGHEFSHMTPDMYARALDDYVPPIRAAYPTARIIAQAQPETTSMTGEDPAIWRTDAVLEAMERNGVEVAAIHVYRGSLVTDPNEQMAAVQKSLVQVGEFFDNLDNDLQRKGLSCAVALTEWNYLLEASQYDGATQLDRYGPVYHETYDARHCLYIAGMIHLLARRAPHLELANFYNMIGPYGPIGWSPAGLEWTAAARTFSSYRELLPGRIVDTELGGGCDHLDILAVEGKNAIGLFIINYNPDLGVDLEIAGLPDSDVAMTELTAATPTSVPSEKTRDYTAIRDGRLRIDPLSIVRLTAARRDTDQQSRT